MLNKIGLAFVLAGTLGFGGSAFAGTVSCTGDRVFSISGTLVISGPGGTASCLTTGTGNISGNNDPINLLGYTTLDKSDDGATYAGTANELTITGSGTTAGTFTIVFPAGYTNFVLAFKSG